jgi:hypothetical protein
MIQNSLPVAQWSLPIVSYRQSFCIQSIKRQKMMKISTIWIWALVIATTFSSCEIVGGLVKTGFYAGIIVVVLVIILIIWLVRKMRR